MSGRILIDCSGPKSLVAERFGVRRPTPPEQQRMAVWGLYEKAHCAGGIDGGSSLFLRTLDRRAWFWFIPLSDNRASVGVVGSCQSLSGDHARPESVFEEQLVKCPAVVERLADARLAGSFRVERGFGWSSTEAAGDGWLLAGDALAGWDPLFSAGLWFGLGTASLAAAAASAALRQNDCSAAALGDWTRPIDPAAKSLRRLIAAFAADGFCPFEFLAAFPQHQAPLGEMLGGLVGASAGPLLQDLDGWQNQQQPLPRRPTVLH